MRLISLSFMTKRVDLKFFYKIRKKKIISNKFKKKKQRLYKTLMFLYNMISAQLSTQKSAINFKNSLNLVYLHRMIEMIYNFTKEEFIIIVKFH